MARLFGLFGKDSKPNLTPDVTSPLQGQLTHTAQLRDLVKRRLGGQDLGFGEDYLSKTANPVIARREARYREQEVPRINSELSSRGFARSAGAPGTASDAIIRSGQSNQRDIDEIMSKFYQLNEAQKKTDFGQALDEANIMQNQEAGMWQQRAGESERLTNATANQTRSRQADQNAAVGEGIGVIANTISPSLGAIFNKKKSGQMDFMSPTYSSSLDEMNNMSMEELVMMMSTPQVNILH